MLVACAVQAADIDHRGALGGVVSVGAHLDAPLASASAKLVPRLDAMVSAALSEHDDNELFLGAGALINGAVVGIWGGYRLYFGREEWKTFSDVGATAHLHDAFAFGPRIGIGVQYDPSALIGVFAAAHTEIVFGGGLRVGATIAVGVQGRTFVLR